MKRAKSTAPAMPAAAPSQDRWLTRQEAAAWFAERGLAAITRERLERYAAQRRGPPYSRFVSKPHYRESDLQAWLEAEAAANRVHTAA